MQTKNPFTTEADPNLNYTEILNDLAINDIENSFSNTVYRRIFTFLHTEILNPKREGVYSFVLDSDSILVQGQRFPEDEKMVINVRNTSKWHGPLYLLKEKDRIRIDFELRRPKEEYITPDTKKETPHTPAGRIQRMLENGELEAFVIMSLPMATDPYFCGRVPFDISLLETCDNFGFEGDNIRLPFVFSVN